MINPFLRSLASASWRHLLACAALLASAGGSPAAGAPEVLPQQQAFKLEVSALQADMVRAEWNIERGYYLYRDKIKIEAEGAAAQIDPPALPAPHEIKTDAYFGEQGIYRGGVAIDIPVRRPAPGPATLALKITSQGCADAGLCYPPLTQRISVTLPAPAGDEPSSGAVKNAFQNFLGKIGLGKQQQGFLPPDQAYVFTADAPAPDALVARWDIAEGYYLYKQKFEFKVRDNPGIQLGAFTLPRGVPKVDETYGKSEVYYNQALVRLPITRAAGAADTLTLEVKYQGCAEAGLCYPLETRTVALTLPANASAATGTRTVADASPARAAPAVIPEQDHYARQLAGGDRAVTLLTFFGLGLLLAFTPCVLPMMPILSSLIIGQGSQLSAGRGFALSLAYVAAMAVTYTIAGVLAGLFGANLQAMFQNPWVLSAFAAIFVALALAMFGLYDLQIPSSWQTRLSTLSNRQRGGTYVGAGVMGLLSALIVGPCVAAPLAGALIYIGQTGDAWLGGAALFSMSLGMGIPLLAIGATAGRWLPRAGSWMGKVKAVFGVLLLGLAIWMLERVLPEQLTMALWAALLIVTAVHLGAVDRLVPEASGWSKVWKGTGLLLLIYGGLLLVGAASGGKDILQPLRGVVFGAPPAAGSSGADSELSFRPVKGVAGLEAALAQASAEGRPVMLDFYAQWCVSCKELERKTLTDPGVRAVLARATLLRADVTGNDPADAALLKHFGLFGPPAILFFDTDGRERADYRLIGFVEADVFRDHAANALAPRT